MFKPSKSVAIEDPEPERAGPDMFLSREWIAWDERRVRAIDAEKHVADPAWRVRQRTAAEIAILDQAELDVKRAQDALDAIVAKQLARVPTYGDGAAQSIGGFVARSADFEEANNAIEAAISRRSRARAEVDAAQSRRRDAARKDA
ncbi:MAG TPA: hypothetical protein VGQ85_02870 [Candidatus Limnocylindrales bacterium]|nr:hypothetical protein [Candidatus Limnocylindrales bacterium]